MYVWEGKRGLETPCLPLNMAPRQRKYTYRDFRMNARAFKMANNGFQPFLCCSLGTFSLIPLKGNNVRKNIGSNTVRSNAGNRYEPP